MPPPRPLLKQQERKSEMAENTLALERPQQDGEIAQRRLTIEDLMSQAISTGNVEVMQKTFEMWMTLKKETARETYNRSLKAFQEECPPIKKEKAVKNKDRTSVRYKYAPLEHVVAIAGPHLARHGFSWDFDSEPTEHGNKVSCTLKHGDGHQETRSATAPADPMALTVMMMNVDQQHGAAESYAKRRAFLNVTGLIPEGEDSDGVAPTRRVTEGDLIELEGVFGQLSQFRQEKAMAYFKQVYGVESLREIPAKEFKNAKIALSNALKDEQGSAAKGPLSKDHEATLTALIEEIGGTCKAEFFKEHSIKRVSDLPAAKYQEAFTALQQKRRSM